MAKIEDGGPAFPFEYDGALGHCAEPGMSLRDWFAGMAMQGMYANNAGNYNFVGVATAAYFTADAMIKERNRV